MKAMIRNINDNGVRYQALAFWCPGCDSVPYLGALHMVPVNTTEKSPSWDWNGDLEKPTLSPSILTKRSDIGVCHSFLRDGVFEFLGDCTHKMANQHVPMPDLPDWFTQESIDGEEGPTVEA